MLNEKEDKRTEENGQKNKIKKIKKKRTRKKITVILRSLMTYI